MRDRSRCALGLLLLATALEVAAQEPTSAPRDPEPLTVTLPFPSDVFLPVGSRLELRLSRPLEGEDGRLAVMIGHSDLTATFETIGATLVRRSIGIPLPSGENEIVVYQVLGDDWRELGRFPIRVLTGLGFERAELAPALAVNNKGQLAEGHSESALPPERETYQDFTFNMGLQTDHVRGPLSVRSQLNLLGASRREDALRFGERQVRAPLLDLSDYVVRVERGRASVGLGHVSFTGGRHLIGGHASRGVTAAFAGRVASVSAALMGGSNVVGWDDPFGLRDGRHRIASAELGIELLSSRPGAIRLDGSVLTASVLPSPGFTRGGIVDAEESRGGAVQVSASSPSQRIRVSGGVTRSRFENPAEDPQLLGELSLVPVRPETRNAFWGEASAGLVQAAQLLGTSVSLSSGWRFERVDPLYRSVAAWAQADRQQHALDVSGSVGAVNVQLSHQRFHDNLADIPSILTTLSRSTGGLLSLPTATALGVGSALLPTLTVGVNHMHQYGTGVPTGGDFNASHVPDQVTRSLDGASQWFGARWTLGYRVGHVRQDNRQAGRETSDFTSMTHWLSSSLRVGSTLEIGLDANVERQEADEVGVVMRLKRVGPTLSWRPDRLTSLSTFASITRAEDDPRTSESTHAELRVEASRGLDLWTGASGGSRGQVFLRFARQSANSLVFLAPSAAQPADERATWTLASGLTLRVF